VLLCKSDEINFLGGAGKGVLLIKLDKGDQLLAAIVANDDRDTLTVKTSMAASNASTRPLQNHRPRRQAARVRLARSDRRSNPRTHRGTAAIRLDPRHGRPDRAFMGNAPRPTRASAAERPNNRRKDIREGLSEFFYAVFVALKRSRNLLRPRLFSTSRLEIF
jgi:hypothetical protein